MSATDTQADLTRTLSMVLAQFHALNPDLTVTDIHLIQPQRPDGRREFMGVRLTIEVQPVHKRMEEHKP